MKRNADLPAYRDWAPTAADVKGLALPAQQEWLVLPFIRHRDSGTLEKSNFEAALEELRDADPDFELHRFNHWARGWFEIILVRPGSAAAKKAETLARQYEDYPVLDEERLSELESEEEGESWESWGREDFRKALEKEHPDYDFDDATDEELDEWYRDSEVQVEHTDEGPRFFVERAARALDFEDDEGDEDEE